MRISDWSSDVCSSDLLREMVADAVAHRADFLELPEIEAAAPDEGLDRGEEILAERTVARRRAAADERRLLPRQRLGLIIGDRRIHGQHDRRHLGMRTQAQVDAQRSEERSVGKECGSTGSSRWSPFP